MLKENGCKINLWQFLELNEHLQKLFGKII